MTRIRRRRRHPQLETRPRYVPQQCAVQADGTVALRGPSKRSARDRDHLPPKRSAVILRQQPTFLHTLDVCTYLRLMGDEISARRRWSEEETVLALYLYFQLPF